MELVSRVEEVLIWRHGATVTRRARIERALTDGAAAQILLPGLPMSLRDASVRVSVEGGVDVQVTSVRVTLHAAARDDLPPEPDTVKWKQAQRALVRLCRQIAVIEAERGLLQEIAVPERPTGEDGRPPPQSPMVARVAIDGFIDEAVASRDAELMALLREKTRLEEEVAAAQDAVRRRDAAMAARPDEVTKAVTATLDTRGSTAGAEIVLRYDVPGARWAPVYQIHVSGDGTRAKLAMRAVVSQATGEMWRGVRLVLSTALPEAFTTIPKLRSLRIGKAQPPQASPQAFRAPPVGAERLFSDFDRERKQLERLAPARLATRSAPGRPGLPDLFEDASYNHNFTDIPSPEPASGFAAFEDDDEVQLDSLDLDLERGAGQSMRGRRAGETASTKRASDQVQPIVLARETSEHRADRSQRESRSAVAAPRKPKKKVAEKADLREESESVESAEEIAPLSLPSFAHLSLSLPTTSDRGRLAVQSAAEVLLSGLSRPISFDALGYIEVVTSIAAAVQGMPLPDGTEPVERSTGSFDHSYRAEEPIDLPSDGGWHTVPVVAREGACTLRYVVVPREDPSVFRVATLDNPLAAPLLAGPVEVYVGGAFQLTSQLPTVAPGETVELGMGVEPAIRCARNASFEEKRSGERVVAMTELHHTLTIDLRNTLSRQADIEVRERIPQPAKDAEVAIDEEQIAPAWEVYPQRERERPIKGGRRWKITLAAGGATKLTARYVVRIYANNEVVGGNRREA